MAPPNKKIYTTDQPGFALFFAAVLIAAALGFSFRAYFSPKKIESQIRAALQGRTPGLEIQFARAHLVLSQGLWPRLAVAIEDLRIRKSPACGEGWGAEVDQVLVPVQIGSLFSAQPRVGVVEVREVYLRPDRFGGACQNPKVESASTSEKIDGKNNPIATASEMAARPFIDAKKVEDARQWISGFNVHQAQVFFEHDHKFILLKDLKSRFAAGESALVAEGSLVIPAALTMDEALPVFKVKVDLHPQLLTIAAVGRFSEGLLEGVLKTTSDHVSALSVKATTIPLSQFASFLVKAQFIPKLNIQPKFLWLSCQATVGGELSQLFRKNPVDIENCDVEGDAGQLQIAHAVRKADGSWEPFQLKVIRIDIRKVYEALNQEGPSGVLSEFGVLQGEINFASATKQIFSGTVKGLEFYFSNAGVRAQQLVEEIKLKAWREPGQLSGEVSSAILRNGEMNSQIKFQFSEDLKNGELKIQAPLLELDPSVQKLMTGGTFANLSATSDLHFENHKLKSAQGSWQATQYTGESLALTNLQAHVRFADSVFEMQTQAARGSLTKDSAWYRWTLPLLNDHDVKDAVRLLNLHLEVRAQGGQVEWHHLSAQLPNEKLQWSSEGSIARGGRGQLQGRVDVEGASLASQWQLSGTAHEPILSK